MASFGYNIYSSYSQKFTMNQWAVGVVIRSTRFIVAFLAMTVSK